MALPTPPTPQPIPDPSIALMSWPEILALVIFDTPATVDQWKSIFLSLVYYGRGIYNEKHGVVAGQFTAYAGALYRAKTDWNGAFNADAFDKIFDENGTRFVGIDTYDETQAYAMDVDGKPVLRLHEKRIYLLLEDCAAGVVPGQPGSEDIWEEQSPSLATRTPTYAPGFWAIGDEVKHGTRRYELTGGNTPPSNLVDCRGEIDPNPAKWTMLGGAFNVEVEDSNGDIIDLGQADTIQVRGFGATPTVEDGTLILDVERQILQEDLTRAQAEVKRAAAQLVPGWLYVITDAGIGSDQFTPPHRIRIKALAGNAFDLEAFDLTDEQDGTYDFAADHFTEEEGGDGTPGTPIVFPKEYYKRVYRINKGSGDPDVAGTVEIVYNDFPSDITLPLNPAIGTYVHSAQFEEDGAVAGFLTKWKPWAAVSSRGDDNAYALPATCSFDDVGGGVCQMELVVGNGPQPFLNCQLEIRLYKADGTPVVPGSGSSTPDGPGTTPGLAAVLAVNNVAGQVIKGVAPVADEDLTTKAYVDGSGGKAFEKSMADLIALRDGSGLIPGRFYDVTDSAGGFVRLEAQTVDSFVQMYIYPDETVGGGVVACMARGDDAIGRARLFPYNLDTDTRYNEAPKLYRRDFVPANSSVEMQANTIAWDNDFLYLPIAGGNKRISLLNY